jgi:predicted transcriptional regulator
MPNTIPSSADVKTRLAKLTLNQTMELARKSRVPYATLIKIRYGTTVSPGLDTVRRFWARLLAVV